MTVHRTYLWTPSTLMLLSVFALASCGAMQSGSSKDDQRQSVDLVIEADHLVAMDDDGTMMIDAAVAILDGEIIAVANKQSIRERFRALHTLDGEGKVLLPGLINGHSHAAMTLLRGIADDLALMDWLNNYIFPAEVEFVDAEFVRIGTELACWEMIRGGTTTFVDMYYFPDVIADVVDDCGMRALVSHTVIDQQSPDSADAADSLANAEAFVGRWRAKHSRITPIYGPHSNYTLNGEQLAATREVAQRTDSPISIHMSESPFETGYSRDNYGKTSVEFYDSIGFFEGPTIAAHVVWPTAVEIPILEQRGVGVIHNPTSNMKIASGVAPVAELLAAGVNVGLGTDGAASNNDLDMWEEMRLAALLQKVHLMDPEALGAQTVLNMATLGGAEAIGLADSVGSIEVGKRADLIQVSVDDVHFVPTYDVLSHLVYVADEQDVASTIVDGRVLMRDGQVLSVDVERVKREATALAARIQAALAARNNKKSGNQE